MRRAVDWLSSWTGFLGYWLAVALLGALLGFPEWARWAGLALYLAIQAASVGYTIADVRRVRAECDQQLAEAKATAAKAIEEARAA